MRLSFRSKMLLSLCIALIAQVTLIAVPSLLIYCVGVSLVSLVLALVSVVQHLRELRMIEVICNDCAAGDMERRILLPKARGEMLSLIYAVNRFIDVADAYIRESGASADHAARGLFYRNILTSGLSGTWKQAAEQLNKSSHQVRQNLINSVRDAGKRLEASVMQTILTLSSSTRQLMGTAESLNGIATKGSKEAGTLSIATAQTSENMTTIAAAVEEMTAAIKEISKQVSQTNSLSQAAAEEGAKAKTVLDNLIASAAKIGEIAGMINNIASQVNLLALNATIEAARSGEAGKGFAVVAAEVKTLATKTTEATAQVELYIQQTRDEVTRTGEALNLVLARVGEVSQASCVIASAVEEQSATTLEISNNLQQTSRTTQEFSDSVESMAQSSSQTKSAAEEMHHSSTTLAQASETLKEEITRFLLGLETAA